MLDYHDKRGIQRGERKPVQKNRPKKQSYGLFIVAGVAALALSFGAGLLTGRILYRTPTVAAVEPAAQPVAKKEEAAAPDAKAPVTEPSLTFYDTLPAGGKGAMGSGINLTPPAPPAPAQPAAPAPPAAGEEPPPTQKEARYLVQVASYRDKGEAEAAQGKLAERGLPAYLTESRSEENGVWYRLRVGKDLSREEADSLAAKAGKGAIVLAR